MFDEMRALLGTTFVASGLGQLTYSLLFSEYVSLVVGVVCFSIGTIIIPLSFFSPRVQSKKPTGVSLLGLTFCIIGLVVASVGLWLFAPVLPFAILCFVISWGLFKRKMWVRRVTIAIIGLGIPASIVVSTTGLQVLVFESFPLIPFVLVSVYMLWYLTRSHVSSLFYVEEITERRFRYSDVMKPTRLLVIVTIGFLALTSFLFYCYVNPLNDHVILQKVTSSGVQGSGELGSPASGTSIVFRASRGDLLDYTYKYVTGSPAQPAHFWITLDLNGTEPLTMVETIGYNGSGSTVCPQTGRYAVWIGIQRAGQLTVMCDLMVTSLSLRKPIFQMMLLNLFGAVATLFLLLNPRTLSK